MDLIHFTPLILERLCNALLTKRDDVIWRFFETMSALTRLTAIVHHPDADPHTSPFCRPPFLPNAISDMTPEKDEKGEYSCHPSLTSFTSSSATTRCPAPTASN